MGKQFKSSAAMMEEFGHNKGGRGCVQAAGDVDGMHSIFTDEASEPGLCVC